MSGWRACFRIRRRGARIARSTATSCASAISPSRSASSRSGASSTTSPTTRCAPTCCSTSPTSPAARSASSSARWWWCCRGTTRCASPSRCRCSTTCRDGRLILGIGRGARARRVRGLRRQPGGQPRDLRRVGADAARRARDAATCEYDGTIVKQARRAIRPRPFKSFRGRTYAAAVSPESSEIMARLGIGILIIPQKPWERGGEGAQRLSRRLPRRERRRRAAADRRPAGRSATRRRPRRGDARAGTSAATGTRWSATTSSSGDHLTKTKGYESYRQDAGEDRRRRHRRRSSTSSSASRSGARRSSATSRSVDIHRAHRHRAFVGVFSYAGMPYDEAEANLRLFAAEVMPELQKLAAAAGRARARRGDGRPSDVRMLGS